LPPRCFLNGGGLDLSDEERETVAEIGKALIPDLDETAN